MTSNFRLALRMPSMARCTTPCEPSELAPRGSFVSGKPKRITAGIPSDSTSLDSSTIWSADCIKNVGHQTDSLRNIFAGENKHRKNQPGGVKGCLANLAAKGFGARKP